MDSKSPLSVFDDELTDIEKVAFELLRKKIRLRATFIDAVGAEQCKASVQVFKPIADGPMRNKGFG